MRGRDDRGQCVPLAAAVQECVTRVESPDLQYLNDVPCVTLRTWGDGACAVHAMFGTADERLTLEKRDARLFVRSHLQKSWHELHMLVSTDGRQHLTSVETSMWEEFVVPHIGQGRPPRERNEEGMFYDRLFRRENTQLRDDICAHLQVCRDSWSRRQPLVQEFRTQSAVVFNHVFESKLWRHLAANLRLLPNPHVDFTTLSSADLQGYADAGDAEWLRPPWGFLRGQRVVRGTTKPFVADAQGKPRSRYEALFDLRHDFDELRQGFLFEICGGVEMTFLQDVLGRAGDLGLGEDNLDILISFCAETWGNLNQHTLIEGPCVGFAERAWPILVECLSDTTHQYYLSCEEALVLADIAKQNVVIFKTHDAGEGWIAVKYGHVWSRQGSGPRRP